MIGGDLRGEMRAATVQRFDIKPQMDGKKRLEVSHAEMKQPHRRSKPPSIFRMVGAKKMFLQMDKCSSDLDETLEEAVVLVVATQPEMLEHVMRFVIALFVETGEIAEVMGIESVRSVWIGGALQLLDKGGDSICFFHLAHSAEDGGTCSACHFFRRSVFRMNLVSVIQCKRRCD